MSMINVPNIKLSIFSCTTVAVFTILLLLTPIPANAEDPKRQSAKVSRILNRFHAHKLIAKIS